MVAHSESVSVICNFGLDLLETTYQSVMVIVVVDLTL